MNYDLDCAKARLGITDTAQDVEIQAALDTALDLVERYLDRKLMRGESTQVFHCHSGQTVSLERYPVTRIIDANVSYRHVDMDNGLIYFGCGIGGCGYGAENADEISVHYEGGFDVLPPSLLLALCTVFQNVWDSMQGGGAVMSGIDRISIPDIGTLAFSNSSAIGDGGAEASPLGAAIYVLDLFRRYQS